MILVNAVKHGFRHGKAASSNSLWKPEYGTLFDLKGSDLEGSPFDFSALKGKVCLIVNVACDCGYTKSSYTAMTEIYDRLKDQGLEILAFPSNQFGQQESRPENEIRKFVTNKYDVKFPLFAKGDVNGEKTQPVFEFLKKCFPGDITWNFAAKFIVNHEGIPVQRMEKENWTIIENRVKQALADAKAGNGFASGQGPEAADSKESS